LTVHELEARQLLEMVCDLQDVQLEERDGVFFIGRPEHLHQAPPPTELSIDFRDTPVPEVIDFLQQLTGGRLVLDPPTAERLDEEGRVVTLALREVSPRQVLRILCDLLGLTTVDRDGMTLITDSDTPRARRQPREPPRPGRNLQGTKLPPRIQQVLSLLELVEPERALELRRLHRADPERFRQELAATEEALAELLELRQQDPAGFDLEVLGRRHERRALELAEELRAPDAPPGADRVRLQDSLLVTLEELLDVRLQQQERRIERWRAGLEELQDRIDREEDLLERRRLAREELIERRLRELLGASDLYDW
jgi:hypothetical protein